MNGRADDVPDNVPPRYSIKIQLVVATQPSHYHFVPPGNKDNMVARHFCCRDYLGLSKAITRTPQPIDFSLFYSFASVMWPELREDSDKQPVLRRPSGA